MNYLFPLEIWTQIVSLISSDDALALYLTGSSTLRYYLERGAITSYRYMLMPRSSRKWPRWTSKLKLETLRICTHVEFNHWNYASLDILLHIPPTVTAIHMPYRGSTAEIKAVENLGALFPALSSLEIHPSFADDLRELIKNLPRTLEHLELTASAGTTPTMILESVPPALRTLIVHNTLSVDPTHELAALSLPQQLETLSWEISEAPDIALPLTLTSLSEIRQPTNNLPPFDGSMGRVTRLLPEHVKHFDSRENVLRPAFVEVLPRNLESLRVHASFFENMRECLAHLPPALTHLQLVSMRKRPISIHEVLQWPATITHLDLDVQLEGLAKETFFRALPPHLVTLMLPILNLGTPAHLRLLPSSLLTLAIPRVDPDIAPNLPRALRHLLVEKAKLSSECMAALPPMLKKLDVEISLSLQGDPQQLPPLLRTLQLGTFSTKYPDNSLLRPFPDSVKHLKLGYLLKANWVTYLPARLVSLELNMLKRADLNPSGLSALPKTLKRLKIYLGSSIESSDLQNLPPHLTIMHVEAEHSRLVDSDMAKIPRHLAFLKLPPSPCLTKECLSLLPHTLAEFKLGQFDAPFWALQAAM